MSPNKWTAAELIPCRKLNRKWTVLIVFLLVVCMIFWCCNKMQLLARNTTKLSSFLGNETSAEKLPRLSNNSTTYNKLFNSSNIITSSTSSSYELLTKLKEEKSTVYEVQEYPSYLSKYYSYSKMDCGRVVTAEDDQYVRRRTQRRRALRDPPVGKLRVDCASIRARHPALALRRPPNVTDGARAFPLAFARAVYRDYLFLEAELATNYLPENWYCFAIDDKANETFRQRMKVSLKALSECLPNVLLPDDEYAMDRYGHNMWRSLLECMKMLLQYKWEYVINLQNGDIQLKTNEELVQIFKWYSGANDIQFTHIGENWVDFSIFDWSLPHLQLFKNETKNLQLDEHGYPYELQKTKGQVECSLSRPFVEWLANELRTELMLDQLDNYTAVVLDEVFIPTLAANEFLGAPGAFTRQCYGRELAPSLTRFAYWVYGGAAEHLCYSRMQRHNVCVFGLEDLMPNFYTTPYMFANKVLQGADVDLIQCWHEVMLNRTFVQYGLHRLNAEFYTELPQVRYNELIKMNGKVDPEEFDCTYKFLEDVKYGQEWFS